MRVKELMLIDDFLIRHNLPEIPLEMILDKKDLFVMSRGNCKQSQNHILDMYAYLLYKKGRIRNSNIKVKLN